MNEEETEIHDDPWSTKLAALRSLYFLLGFLCGMITILLILIIISTFYGIG